MLDGRPGRRTCSEMLRTYAARPGQDALRQEVTTSSCVVAITV